MEIYTKTLEYETLIDAIQKRKFTKNDIKSFVYKVFSMYERATCVNEHVDVEAFHEIVDENIYVDFPDYQIRNREEFKEWHRWIHGLMNSDDHEIEKIDVEFLANGKYQARFIVRWRADFKDGTYVDSRIEQMWIMREENDRDLPVIERYLAAATDHILAQDANEES